MNLPFSVSLRDLGESTDTDSWTARLDDYVDAKERYRRDIILFNKM